MLTTIRFNIESEIKTTFVKVEFEIIININKD